LSETAAVTLSILDLGYSAYCNSQGQNSSIPAKSQVTSLDNKALRTPTTYETEDMARKSQRLSAGAAIALPSHKRTASNTSLPAGDAKKTKTQKATPTKSQYFSKGKQNDTGSGYQDDEDESAPEEDEDDDPPSAAEEDLSEFGSAPESDDAGDDEDDDDEEHESEIEQPKSRRKSASAKATTASSKKQAGGELWREGVKTGLGPGQEVIIKKPKARPAGKVHYSDETIHPNTLLFLQDLKGNNNREWLKSEYRCCDLLWTCICCY